MDTEIGQSIASIVENPNDLIVPTITLYEVFKKLSSEKDKEYAQNVITYMQTGTIIELNAELSLSAADISRKYKLAMADSIIYSTAQHYSAMVFSCDIHFKDLPNVTYFLKK